MSPAAPVRTDATGRQVPQDEPTSDRSPSFWRRHRQALTMALGVLVAICFVYFVLPRIVALGPTLKRLRGGDVWWLALGVGLEIISYFGAIVLFRGVFGTSENRINWRASYQIIVAGTAATKLFAAAGAGGIALMVWALRGYGVAAAEIGDGMVCYEILTYSVDMGATAIAGFGLWFGVFSGPAPIGLTLIPAIAAIAVIAIVLSMLLVDEPTERFLLRRAERSGAKASRWWRRVATLPRAIHAGLLAAIEMVKRRDRALIGALISWGFDIAVLWASFRAFGQSPPGAVIVMGYYVGMLGNVLPLPGGVGGVEGGMIAAFIGFGVPAHVAVLAVLAYRTISYWLPTVPGVIAYWQLRRSIHGAPGRIDAEENNAQAQA